MIDANKDASPKLIAKAVLQREIEHQAKQYAVRLDTNTKSDAKELADALRGVTVDTSADDEAEK